MKHAVVYCRVSSKKQVREGHGLSSQEATCRQYAKSQGFTVTRVFRDDYSGGGDFWARPGITALLAFLEEREEQHAVIFDDIKRFARDTLFHLKLRQELAARDAYPLCPTFRFEDTPEGEFVETVIAATAQLEREQNRRQVIRRMKARLEAGYWVFPPPLGYRFAKRNGEKLLVHEQPAADVAREALEQFARGELVTQLAVREFLMSHGCRSDWTRDGLHSPSAARRFLANEIYCGWCVCSKWGIRVRGRHEPLISEATHRKIMDRLAGEAKPLVRLQDREEFPLRGVARCAHCDRGITAYWARGRSKKYPYYRCLSKRCVNIRKERMEELLLERLWEAVPDAGRLQLFERLMLGAFGDREKLRRVRTEASESRIAAIDKETATLLDALSRAPSAAVQKLYEERIAALQTERDRCEGQMGIEPDFEVELVLDAGRDILRDPHDAWHRGNLRQRRLVQELAFDPPLRFHRHAGYRTAEFSFLYRLLMVPERDDSTLVDLMKTGLNPAAEELARWGRVLGIGGSAA